MKKVEQLEQLIIAAIRLAIVRHDLCDDEGDQFPDPIAQEIAEDTAAAIQGEGTCDTQPIPEWIAALASHAPSDSSTDVQVPSVKPDVAPSREEIGATCQQAREMSEPSFRADITSLNVEQAGSKFGDDVARKAYEDAPKMILRFEDQWDAYLLGWSTLRDLIAKEAKCESSE